MSKNVKIRMAKKNRRTEGCEPCSSSIFMWFMFLCERQDIPDPLFREIKSAVALRGEIGIGE
jgi:hypothetical protein